MMDFSIWSFFLGVITVIVAAVGVAMWGVSRDIDDFMEAGDATESRVQQENGEEEHPGNA